MTTRPATKTEIWQALTILSALPKPKGVSSEVTTIAYEIALDGVPAEALAQAAKNLLRHSKFMPSPSELYLEIQRIAHPEDRQRQAAKAKEFQEDEVL